MQWETDDKNGTFRPVKRQRNSLGMQGLCGITDLPDLCPSGGHAQKDSLFRGSSHPQ